MLYLKRKKTYGNYVASKYFTEQTDEWIAHPVVIRALSPEVVESEGPCKCTTESFVYYVMHLQNDAFIGFISFHCRMTLTANITSEHKAGNTLHQWQMLRDALRYFSPNHEEGKLSLFSSQLDCRVPLS